MRGVVKCVFVTLLLCCGCGRSGERFIDMQPVDVREWTKPVSIIYENCDTTSLKDISVALRYNNSFDSDTLTVVIQTSLPDAHQTRERVLLRLDKKYQATAITASQCVGYRERCLLNQSGSYIFTIIPCRSVRGIEAVGVDIVE